MDNQIDTNLLTTKAKDLNDRFFLLLNEIVKVFPDAKINPDTTSKYDLSKDNKDMYNEAMGKMLELQNEYFMFNNTITKETNNMLDYVTNLDKNIQLNDALNKKLLSRLSDLKSSSHSAEGLFDDALLSRNQILFGNTVLFIAICAGGYFGYNMIKTKQ